MLKHAQMTPDTATVARLFVTRFETNELIDKTTPAIEIESASGSITQVAVETSDAHESYSVKISALPQGDYTVRARLTYDGKIDTATFSGVSVATQPISETESGMPWARRFNRIDFRAGFDAFRRVDLFRLALCQRRTD